MKHIKISKNAREAVLSEGDNKTTYTKMEIDVRLAKETDKRVIKLLEWARKHMVY